MGSLFDGIGGFPLAAVRNGIRPVWASEIEAFPIEVTKLRFPDMVHVGDITKLNGAELPPVNIICGGSPCQDLSVAGARAGLAGARSGLFMEQVRLTKEMRNADELRGRAAIDAEQDGSIELQEEHFRTVIDGNRNWINAGIYSERTTGLKLEKREKFLSMIRKCKNGKIDLILTKSISRFGRNTLDELRVFQDLRALGVDVYFEQENLWLHDQQVQMLITNILRTSPK